LGIQVIVMHACILRASTPEDPWIPAENTLASIPYPRNTKFERVFSARAGAGMTIQLGLGIISEKNRFSTFWTAPKQAFYSVVD
jgi:hypothetical protein